MQFRVPGHLVKMGDGSGVGNVPAIFTPQPGKVCLAFSLFPLCLPISGNEMSSLGHD